MQQAGQSRVEASSDASRPLDCNGGNNPGIGRRLSSASPQVSTIVVVFVSGGDSVDPPTLPSLNQRGGRMVRRRLGKTDFEITTIGLGTWAVGGRQWGPQDDEASIGAIHAAIDHGINWVDTAPIYGSGHSEEVV